MIPYDEVHQTGSLSIELGLQKGIFKGDVGVQIASDGRIWICFNGQALIRFKPDFKKLKKFTGDQKGDS